jgi:exodeoxyribonuclease VII large subunit
LAWTKPGSAARVEGLAARLEAVSYNAVLARGFALVQGAGGKTVTTAAEVAPGARLNLTFQDGQVSVTAATPRPVQGTLF